MIWSDLRWALSRLPFHHIIPVGHAIVIGVWESNLGLYHNKSQTYADAENTNIAAASSTMVIFLNMLYWLGVVERGELSMKSVLPFMSSREGSKQRSRTWTEWTREMYLPYLTLLELKSYICLHSRTAQPRRTLRSWGTTGTQVQCDEATALLWHSKHHLWI